MASVDNYFCDKLDNNISCCNNQNVFEPVTYDWLTQNPKISQSFLKYYCSNYLKSPYYLEAPDPSTRNLMVGYLKPRTHISFHEPHILQLFQRQSEKHYDKFYYYTIIRKNHQAHVIPITNIYINGIHYNNISGINELFDGDIIQGIKGLGDIMFKFVRTASLVIPN